MKKIFYLLWIMAAVGVAACGDNDTDYVAANALDVKEAVVDFHSIGGEASITLADGNSDIKVECNAEWCNITGTSDRVISFTVLPNENMQTRTATFYITTNQAKGQLAVTQSGVIVNYESSDFHSYADNVAFTRRIEFSSELQTSAKVDEDGADWLSCEKTAGGFMVSAEANNSGDARFGKVTLRSGEISKTYTFLQYGMKDFCKEWNAAFLSASGEKGTDIFSIQKSGDKQFTINIKMLKYEGIKAIYENGALKISCGQYLREQNKYSLYLGVLGVAQTPGIASTVTYQMKPCLQKDGKWGLALADDGSLGEAISALATWAIAENKVVGYWDLFSYLTLSF